jgi:hypothetical protein
VLCKWPNDGLYYSATVECSTFNHTQSLTYRVTFSEYGNVEEVPLEYVANKNANVKHLLAGSGAASKAKGKGGTKRSAAGATEETELVIPEHLKIKPTDTDKVRIFCTTNTIEQVGASALHSMCLRCRKRSANERR